jgi:hypothetical protein
MLIDGRTLAVVDTISRAFCGCDMNHFRIETPEFSVVARKE